MILISDMENKLVSNLLNEELSTAFGTAPCNLLKILENSFGIKGSACSGSVLILKTDNVSSALMIIIRI